MLELLEFFRDHVKREFAHVRQYPVHFVLSVLVVSSFIWWFVDTKYEDDLERVRGVRDDYAIQLQNTQSQLNEIKPEFERLSALEEELDDLYARTHTQISRVKILMRFVVEGNELLVQEVESDKELYGWLKKLGHWEQTALFNLNLFSKPTGQAFNTVTVNNPSHQGFDKEHAHQKDHLSKRVQILTDYVREMEMIELKEAREKARQEEK